MYEIFICFLCTWCPQKLIHAIAGVHAMIEIPTRSHDAVHADTHLLDVLLEEHVDMHVVKLAQDGSGPFVSARPAETFCALVSSWFAPSPKGHR